MKLRSNVHAGYSTVEECQRDADYWKSEAYAMQVYANTGSWPAGYPYPVATYPSQPPVNTGGGGYVSGVYYPDYSGTCTGILPPTPPSSSGGYVNGVWYSDFSGTCTYA